LRARRGCGPACIARAAAHAGDDGLLSAPLRPPMPAVADPVEVLAAVHGGTTAVEVHADFVARSATRAARAHVGKWRQRRDVNGWRRHRALLPVTRMRGNPFSARGKVPI